MNEYSLLGLLNQRRIYSVCSNLPVVFLKDIQNAPRIYGVAISDGMSLIDDDANIEDDISKMYAIDKEGNAVNLEDFYSENDAYSRDSNKFYDAIMNMLAYR